MKQVGESFYQRQQPDLTQTEAEERAEELFDMMMDEEKTKKEVLEMAESEGETILVELKKYF